MGSEGPATRPERFTRPRLWALWPAAGENRSAVGHPHPGPALSLTTLRRKYRLLQRKPLNGVAMKERIRGGRGHAGRPAPSAQRGGFDPFWRPGPSLGMPPLTIYPAGFEPRQPWTQLAR